MGARGPRPELAEIKRLKGNPGKRPLPEGGVVASGEPFVPDHLEDDAKACVEMIRRSMPPGVYARSDSFALAAYGAAWALHKAAVEALRTEPRVVQGSRGPQPSPWVKIQNQQAQLMMSLGDRLGLDPKARAALKLPDEKPASKFDGLLCGVQ